ncbi:branched-chain amino acid ABC transporter permease [Microlunatus flavus]|uniref:Branched-chain amino acid transport system permease protein n=1 Tax=Microlunatus flavus TaxID=1036181 RepID=A0A1H9HB54_9ACTN|nr:branched-chain amino acid ABC transporter permease [Microlunatus flavus]SEQ59560.1 branched-chain amino acid transport system permease protein [Microlunatus flavus]
MAAASHAAPSSSGGQRSLGRLAWPIGYVVVILFLFFLYFSILPSLVKPVSAPVLAWLPVATINECLMWAIMALGLNVVVGYAGLLDLGYVAFWALGGYTAGWLMAFPFNWTWDFHLFSPVKSTLPGTHINFWLVCIVAGILCAILGLIIGAPTLRLRGDYLALVTLGFGEVITQFFRNSGDIAGFNLANGDPGISPIDPIGTGPLGAAGIAPPLLTNSAAGNVWKILVLGLLVGICIFVSLRIREGRLGRAWLALREDELAASMMGVPLVRVKLLAYAVGAFFGGIGGVANASAITTAVSPSGFDFGKSVLVLLMVVLGGMGNVWGVTIGAFLLSWLNSNGLKQIGVQIDAIAGTNLEASLPRYNYVILGLLLVLMMLFRREGLIPESRTKALMQMPSRTEAESLGADSLEAEAETDAVEHSDAGADAKIAASAAAMAGSGAAAGAGTSSGARREDES